MTGTGGRLVPAVLLLLLVAGSWTLALGATNSQDAAALQSLLSGWQNAPPSWGNGDPCDNPWEGLTCANSRVTSLKLSTMNITGTLSGDIALLTELQTLDLSYNPGLGGSLTANIGSLSKLNTLILLGCSFTGPIPGELGNLPLLTYISLNNNKFTGPIPASLGKLSKLYWLDLAENQLSGSLPVSSGSSPGLDMLSGTKHFHFNKNKLSGNIPPQIFNSNMTLIHILFDQNQFTGVIPDSIGLVTTLEVLRLDRNQLNGTIPSSINNLTRVNEVHLANNQLTGVIPDLSGLSSVNYLDLSNNSFTPSSEAPTWFTKLSALTTLVIEGGQLGGQIPTGLFAIPQLQQVSLKNNSFNGTLDLTGTVSQQLQLVDLRYNGISVVPPGNRPRATIMLYGNPYCSNLPSGNPYCLARLPTGQAYTTSLANCGSTFCSQDQSVNPGNCGCAIPYKGTMVFRAPSFSDLTNSTRFQSLERSLWTTLGLGTGAVYLQNILFNSDNYLQIQVSLFPSQGLFNRSQIQTLGFFLSNQTYKAPAEFGPYYFMASLYNFAGSTGGGKSSFSTGAVVGIAVACSVLLIGLIIVGLYALKQNRKAKKAFQTSHPFASWVPSGSDQASAPELKGARWFYFDDLKKCTSNFSQSNMIGEGGYGKVYRGTLSSGQMVAIKRAEQGSMQGALEFKTEIELLSRLHHKNLVGLVGFCYDKGEQMLVYEYVPNGTLRENLSGETGIPLDWNRRLRIALGSARGLAYLHELADPPIIHRDVKSSNILLDEELNAKVADFGLSKLISDTEKGHVSTQVKGTLGYLDPEYYMTQQLTDKSDVYSFGVVMLELITAKLPIEKGKYIVREIRSALNVRDEAHYGLDKLMDPTIRDSPFITFTRFVDLALQCVQESAVERPSMNEVVKEIETMLQLEGSNPASAASSATEFRRGNPPRHPYSGHLPTWETSSDSFDNSTGYTVSSTIEPK